MTCAVHVCLRCLVGAGNQPHVDVFVRICWNHPLALQDEREPPVRHLLIPRDGAATVADWTTNRQSVDVSPHRAKKTHDEHAPPAAIEMDEPLQYREEHTHEQSIFTETKPASERYLGVPRRNTLTENA